MSDSKSSKAHQQFVVETRPQITREVRVACRKYNHGAPPDEVAELSAQILLLLLEGDCRRLKTYDPAKAKLSIWLRRVIHRYVSHHFQKQPSLEPIEALSEYQFSYAAKQEKELLVKEERKRLREAIRRLTPHEQRIAHLKLSEATDEEIAQEINIGRRSVQQEWSRIGKKLKSLFKKEGGAKIVPL